MEQPNCDEAGLLQDARLLDAFERQRGQWRLRIGEISVAVQQYPSRHEKRSRLFEQRKSVTPVPRFMHGLLRDDRVEGSEVRRPRGLAKVSNDERHATRVLAEMLARDVVHRL